MSYLKPAVRKEEILVAAVAVAEREGFSSMRREDVAIEAGCSVGSVNRYFGNMNQLRKAVMRRAVIEEVLPIIAYGVITNNPCALKAPERLLNEAIESVR